MAKKKPVEKTTYRGLQGRFTFRNYSFFNCKQARDLYHDISTGNNSYVRVNRRETSSFDNEWIEKIENCIPELEEIIRNPRRITETIGNVVPVELAKKTNGDSVRHLATHTQNVKEITEDNNVIPSKILSIESDDFYAIYENRFIATLIRKLMLFIEKRYEFVRDHALLKDIEELKVKSKTIIDGSLVEIETKVKIVKPADYEGIENANNYMERILDIRKHLSYCYNSDFMKMMKTEKNVRNPILQTNIIRKNPTYHKCYELYRYIEAYHGAGINYSVNDEYMSFNQKELAEINNMLMVDFLALYPNQPSKFATLKHKECKPKILSSIDDEEFIYGPYLKGPVEFVRVDKDYRDETEKQYEFYREEDTYDKPDNYVPKRERVTQWMKGPDENYVSDLRLQNRAMRLMKDAKDSLMSRKRKASIAFEKKALKIIEKREQELKMYEAKQKLAEELQNKSIKDKAREELISKAKYDALEMKKSQTQKENKEIEEVHDEN